MKKELDYFTIGDSFGGNQDWFKDHWMHLGGCAAATACDSCIALEKAGIKKNLYPFDINNLSKTDYIDFAMKMKPYLKPRWSGIDRPDIYVDGMNKYLSDMKNTDLCLEVFENGRDCKEAWQSVKWQISAGFPVPFLLLRHRNRKFKELLWHWFMLVGYLESEGRMNVKIATYGESFYLPFDDMWNSGFEKNGGMIIYS